MSNGDYNGIVKMGWPAAKYLPYAFWRAWFLVMYSSPFWLYFALPEEMNPGLQMHYASTACFVVASVLLAVFHVKAVQLLASTRFMLLAGLGASVGVALEFSALAAGQDPFSALFVVGAALTGLGTAPIALRTGQVYASVRVRAALTATLLSDVAAGLIFFFAIGTWPAIGLLIAVVLPLLAALTLVVSTFGDSDALEEQCHSAPSAPTRPFVYFLVSAFFIGAVAFLQNSLGGSWFTQANIDNGSTLGVSLLIVTCFLLAVGFAYVKKVRLEALYRPTILCLSACVLFAYLIDFGSSGGIGGTLLVYCLFSSYIWVLMAYLGHGCYFSPVQVFGYGRAVYAGGSLVGGLVGMYLLPTIGDASSIPTVAVVMVAILLLCAVAVRPQDLASILVDENASEGAVSSGASEDGASVASATSSATCSVPLGVDTDDSPSPVNGSDSSLAGVSLSPREREVYVLMRTGRDAAYIADSLCISRNTAKTHIRNIYGKFGVHTRQEFIDVHEGR